jgi:hypothetical protein
LFDHSPEKGVEGVTLENEMGRKAEGTQNLTQELVIRQEGNNDQTLEYTKTIYTTSPNVHI